MTTGIAQQADIRTFSMSIKTPYKATYSAMCVITATEILVKMSSVNITVSKKLHCT